MRLTRKDGRTYFMFDKNANWKRSIEITKLGQLEDIEDELGIDLFTLFKALKQRFAYMFVQNDYNENYKKGLIKPLIVSNFYKYGEDYKLVLCDSLTCLSYYVCVKDYGKTWALTKEELG